MLYELWDYESRNLLGAFETEAAALQAVRQAIEIHGPAYVAAWALGRADDAGLDDPLVEGSDLAERALKAVRA